MADQGNRPHRETKAKKAHTGGPNPKAFAFSAPGRLQKTAARSHDVRHCAYLHSMIGTLLTNVRRSKKSASTSRLSTASPKKRPQSSSASSVPQA
jgi:hypothetical protein